MNLPKIFKKENSPILILLLLLLIIFYPVLFNNKALFYFDVASLDQGLITYTANFIKSGEFPLFGPHLLSGNPLIGVYPPLFYPPMILFLLLPFHLAFGILAVFHYFMAGLGVYLIGRFWKFKKSSSFLGAAIFALNGFLLENYYVYNILFASVWIPYLFLYTEKLIEEFNLKHFLLLVLFSSLQLATGRLDYFYFTQMFLWIWIAWKFLKIYHYESILPLKKIPVLMLPFLVSVLLLSVEIIPLLDYLRITERKGGLNIQSVLVWSLNPFQIVQLIFNNLFGDMFYNRGITSLIIRDIRDFKEIFPLFYNLYIGLPTLLLIIYGIYNFRKNSKILPLLFISIFFLVLSFGKYGFLYELFYNFFPGFNISRYPIKLYIIFIFCISLLAGLSFEILISENEQNSLLRFSIISFFMILLSAVLLFFFNDNFLDTLNFILSADLLKIDNLTFLFSSLGKTLGFVSLFIIILLALKLERITKTNFAVLVITLICLDLTITGMSNLFYIDKDEFYKKPEILNEIESTINDKSLYRIYGDLESTYPVFYQIGTLNNFKNISNDLSGNRFLLYGLKSLKGDYLAIPRDYYGVIKFLDEKSGKDKITLEAKINILRIMGLRYYIWHSLNSELDAPDKKYFRLIKLYKEAALELWELKDYQPIITFKSKALVNSSEQNIYNILFQSDKYNLDLAKEVVLIYENDAYRMAISKVKKNIAPEIKQAKISLLKETANTINIEAEAPTSGYLVIANNYFTGWKAYDNGTETPILKANFNQQAIRIGGGKHHIILKYLPDSFILGRTISLIVLIILLGLTTFQLVVPKKNESL